MSDLTIPRWLRKSPAAVKVRATLEDGSQRILNVGDPKNQRRWSECRDAIIALKAVQVEALDREGDVLRVINLENEEQAEERQAKQLKEKIANETQLVQIARLLNEASDAAAARHEAAYLKSFEMVTNLAKSVLDAHNKQVTMVSGLLRKLQSATANGAAEGDGVTSMLTQVLMGRGLGPMNGGPMGGPNGVIAQAQAAAAAETKAEEADEE